MAYLVFLALKFFWPVDRKSEKSDAGNYNGKETASKKPDSYLRNFSKDVGKQQTSGGCDCT